MTTLMITTEPTPKSAPLELDTAPSLSIIEPSPMTAIGHDYGQQLEYENTEYRHTEYQHTDREYDPEMPTYTVRWLRPHYATMLLDLPTAPVAQTKDHWHAFTEEESDELESEWWRLPDDERRNCGPMNGEEHRVPDELDEDDEDLVGVAIYKDKLFEVDVSTMELRPIYWRRQTTHPVPVMRAHWMFDTTHPVPEPLNSLVEDIYREAKPWTLEYADALDAALDIGPEAYQKFKYDIPGNKQQQSVFFQDGESARLVSEQMATRIQHAVYASLSRNHGSIAFPYSTRIYRGYDAAQRAPPRSRPPSRGTSPGGSRSASRMGSPLVSPVISPADRSFPRKLSMSLQQRSLDPMRRQPSLDFSSVNTSSAPRAINNRNRSRSLRQPSMESLRSSTPPPPVPPLPRNRMRSASLRQPQPPLSTQQPSPPLQQTSMTFRRPSASFRQLSAPLQQTSTSLRRPSAESLDLSDSSNSEEDDEVELVHTYLPSKTGEEDRGEVTDLVFMVHGIGQAAVTQFEGVNWVYSTNLFRQIARKQSATPALSTLMRNSRVQFLPVQWRSRFAKLLQELHQVEQAAFDRNTYTLSEIMLKGHVTFARDLLNNVVLDLAYYMSRNRDLMTRAICIEANAVYRKWCARHPGFDKRGRVHVIAHSLGCSIVAHVMSNQPTHVPPLSTLPVSRMYPTDTLLFNTSALFLCGSPCAMTMMLEQAPLIARKGRERSKYPRPDESLDKVGQLGCMAVDSVYNVFYPADVIAYRLNPTVDTIYGTELQPTAITSINASILGRISKALFSLPSALLAPPMRLRRKLSFPTFSSSSPPAPRAEVLDSKAELERTRGKRRFAALNPHGTLDFYLPGEGINQYIDMITAHVVYWNDAALAAFVLGEIFADQGEKERP